MTSLSRLAMYHGELDALPLLRAMINDEFKNEIALITSFGADAALLLSMVAEVNAHTPILFLETGKHFPETLEYGCALTEQLGLQNVHWLTPDAAMVARIDPNGDLWSSTPDRCCWLRKVEPLDRAVAALKLKALITGRKRYQTLERAELQTIELDDKNIFRINPIALWSRERQAEEIARRNLPPHPLIAKGYKSIGCAPCTKPVAEGEDERAGRWAHTIGLENEQKTECGIHLPADVIGDWAV
jgi:phosphoadenosine phosphosulfate reductase